MENQTGAFDSISIYFPIVFFPIQLDTFLIPNTIAPYLRQIPALKQRSVELKRDSKDGYGHVGKGQVSNVHVSDSPHPSGNMKHNFSASEIGFGLFFWQGQGTLHVEGVFFN